MRGIVVYREEGRGFYRRGLDYEKDMVDGNEEKKGRR